MHLVSNSVVSRGNGGLPLLYSLSLLRQLGSYWLISTSEESIRTSELFIKMLYKSRVESCLVIECVLVVDSVCVLASVPVIYET